MPSRAIASAVQPVTSAPANRTWPAAGLTSPQMACARLDLPAPLAPSTAMVHTALGPDVPDLDRRAGRDRIIGGRGRAAGSAPQNRAVRDAQNTNHVGNL